MMSLDKDSKYTTVYSSSSHIWFHVHIKLFITADGGHKDFPRKTVKLSFLPNIVKISPK